MRSGFSTMTADRPNTQRRERLSFRRAIGPCRAMAPVFENAAREFEPRLRLAKVDTDAEPDLAARYRIQAIPTMVLMRGGREIARHSGVMSVGKLRGWLEQTLRG